MGNKAYKYAGADVIGKAFSQEGYCNFKCSYPKDFNDPYELFLTIDYNQEPDILAYYLEAIGKLPQLATTCFSKSPDVIPMWAHYAHNHQGVVIEVDEDILSEYLPEVRFGDIDYLDEPDESILEFLQRAHATCKARHVYFLQNAVFSAAYYTKNTCWSYEEEKRLVVAPEDCIELNELLLIQLPTECITALIVGHQSTSNTKESIKDLSDKLECSYYEMHIGRSNPTPYFSNDEKCTYTFNGSSIARNIKNCRSCNEPIHVTNNLCPWCSIEHTHKTEAAIRNPMRMMDKIGMLERYYREDNEIGRGFKK